MKYCTRCGKKIEKNTKFCGGCGFEFNSLKSERKKGENSNGFFVHKTSLNFDAPNSEALQIAPYSKRVANYLIDGILGTLLFAFLLGVIFAFFGIEELIDEMGDTFFSITCSFLYYFCFEVSTGKTIGKYITNTKVVMSDGSKPTFIVILSRTICRFVPLDLFSFANQSHPAGWHDRWSNTTVVLD